MDLFFVNSISEFLHWKQTSTPPSAHFIAPEVPSEIPRFEDDYAWWKGRTRHGRSQNDQRGGFSTKTQKSFVGNIQRAQRLMMNLHFVEGIWPWPSTKVHTSIPSSIAGSLDIFWIPLIQYPARGCWTWKRESSNNSLVTWSLNLVVDRLPWLPWLQCEKLQHQWRVFESTIKEKKHNSQAESESTYGIHKHLSSIIPSFPSFSPPSPSIHPGGMALQLLQLVAMVAAHREHVVKHHGHRGIEWQVGVR